LAGAFLAKVKPGDDNIYSVLASVFVGVAFVVQGASMLLAVLKITDVVGEHGEELAKPRPEHDVVAKLTQQEAAANEAYKQVSDWGRLNLMRKAMITGAAALILGSCFAFAMLGELCFENFQVSGQIGDALDEHGLGGNPLNIVLFPGKIALGCFFFAVILHCMFAWDMGRLAKLELAATASKSQAAVTPMQTVTATAARPGSE